MIKIKRENFTVVGHDVDYELENGVMLYRNEWNGEAYYVKDGNREKRYVPVSVPVHFDEDTGEPDLWETIGFEER
jgi:hypothetical protein